MNYQRKQIIAEKQKRVETFIWTDLVAGIPGHDDIKVLFCDFLNHGNKVNKTLKRPKKSTKIFKEVTIKCTVRLLHTSYVNGFNTEHVSYNEGSLLYKFSPSTK